MADDKEKADEQSSQKEPFFSVPSEDNPTASCSGSAEGLGTQVGPYKLLGILGEGGFGIVYLAEEREPIKRRVALKIIKPGMDSKEVLARFDAERQTLALLDHPNIAHILGAGMTRTGRPYFAMEYVRGLSITEYCDHHKLSIKERLELFLQVCKAVQYAHQKGIIHRDIKPSNILVSGEDDQRLPKVIDFGVAKAMGRTLTEQTLYTQAGQVVGTPEYMSPEQAQMSPEGIDTRSDIYSLGAVLYELLVGVLPFDPERLRCGGIDAMRRMICEEEPKTPSTRLTGLGEAGSKVALQRQTDAGSLARCLHRELEWIPLMAMRKDRERRYQSVSELANDIENYLKGAPLLAGPESAVYRVRKFVQRHAGAVAAATALLLTLVVGLLVSIAMYSQAEQARNTAKNQAEARRRALYCNSVARAYAEYQSGYAGNIRRLLASCPADLRGWEWHYLSHICDEARLTINGHNHVVTAVAFSPSGERIVSASIDSTIKLWDAKTGDNIMSLRAHDPWVRCMAFSHDGRRIISGGTDKRVKIWDAEMGRELGSLLQNDVQQDYEVISLAPSPDGKRLASGGLFGVIRVWDLAGGAEVMSLNGHTGDIPGILFSPDGRWIVSSSTDKTINLWDAADGSVVRTLRGHSASVGPIVLSPDGQYIISGDWDGNIKKWDVASGTQLMTFRAHEGEVISLSLSSDGQRLASGSADCTIKVWDMATANQLTVLHGHSQSVTSVAFSPDGTQLVSGSLDRTVKVWEASTDRECRILSGHEGHVSAASFSPDSKVLASCDVDNTIRLWDVASGKETTRLSGHTDGVSSVAFSSDGRRLASGSWDKTIKIWDSKAGCELSTLCGHTDGIYSVAFSPDDSFVVSGGPDENVRIWDPGSGKETMTLRGHQGTINTVCVSPDSRYIASGGINQTVKIWDAGTGSEIATLEGLGAEVRCAVFSPDSRCLVAVGRTAELSAAAKVWNLATRKVTMTLEGHSEGVHSVDFARDGGRIVTASVDDTVRIWDAATGSEIVALHMVGTVLPWITPSVAFSPDCRTLAVANSDKVLIFDSAMPTEDRTGSVTPDPMRSR